MAKKLTLAIRGDLKIQTIQKEFNALFPYLSIEFFSKPHSKFGGSSKRFLKSPTKTLGECRTIAKKGKIEITPSMIVNTLEKLFQDLYGLSVQVFRKSGNTWLETTATDAWSLEKQNSEGEALSKMKLDKPDTQVI